MVGQGRNLIRQRFFTLKDFSSQGRAYFSEDFDFDEAAVRKNFERNQRLRELLPALADRLEKIDPLTPIGEAASARFQLMRPGSKLDF